MIERFERHLANGFTILGAVLGFAAAFFYPTSGFAWLALASLLCDALDGWVARFLDLETDFGATLDWTVDCAVAHVLLWRVLPPECAAVLSSALAIAHAWAREHGHRFTARWLVTLLAIGKAVIR